MTIMNRVILSCFLLVFVVLTGCTLSEKIEVEINAKPTLLVEYPFDDEYIRSVHLLIYDQRGVFFDSLVFFAGVSMSSSGSDTLLSGVPEGEYSVVCYANLKQSEISNLDVGVSMLDDLIVSLDSEHEYSESDELFHCKDNFLVKRGVPVNMTMDLIPRYYNVELLLQSEKDNITPVEEYSARLERVPSGVCRDGYMWLGEGSNVAPKFVNDIANYRRTSEFILNRFDDEHGVMLVLFRMGKLIARIPISPSLYDIDSNDTEQVTLPIDITIAVDKLTVTILDWSTVIVQNENIGG